MDRCIQIARLIRISKDEPQRGFILRFFRGHIRGFIGGFTCTKPPENLEGYVFSWMTWGGLTTLPLESHYNLGDINLSCKYDVTNS
jgi:hypothetical protein